MKLKHSMPRLLGAVLLLLLGSAGAAAQAPRERAKKSTWKPVVEWSTRASFDDNVFLASEGRKDDLDGEGRFAGMNRAQDLVGTVEVEAGVRGRGFASRRLELGARARYDAYTFNPGRSHVELGAFAAQSLTPRDRVALALEYAPSVFRRNYLAGGGAGYAPGVYREMAGELAYQRELTGGVVETEGEIALLLGRRAFADFPWRDRTELGVGLGADVRLFRALEVDLSAVMARHDFAAVAEPVRVQRRVTTAAVRRDRTEVGFGIEPRLRLGKRSALELGYHHRVRDYLATLREDPVFGGRVDRRDTFEGGLRLPVGRRMDLRVGALLQEQRTARPGRGETGDEQDYHRMTGYLQLRYRP